MSDILNISEAVSIALHAMTLVAAQEEQVPLSVREIAETLNVSEHHLSKVFQRLTKARLVKPHRGPKGGVTLVKDPDKTSLLEVYEVIEGELESNKCLLKTRLCKPGNCIFGDLIGNVNKQVKDYLSKTKLSDLKHVFEDHQLRAS